MCVCVCCCVTQLCPTLCDSVDCSMPGASVPHHLLNFAKVMSITSMMPSSHLILWRPLLLPSIFPSIRDFSNESVVCIKWPKYWSFIFNVSSSNEYSGLNTHTNIDIHTQTQRCWDEKNNLHFKTKGIEQTP